MKKILSVLLVFVFLQVQSRAFAPDYGGLGLNPVGTYGGTMVPSGAAVTDANGVSSATSLGLFSLGVPQVGLSTGSFALFIQGGAYVGGIVGYVDPTTQGYSAILSGASLFTVPVAFSTGGANPTITIVQQSLTADGQMEAVFAQQILTAGAGQSTTLIGTATFIAFFKVDATTGAPITTATQTYTVSGVLQSGTVSPTTITLTGSGTSGGG